MSDRQALSDAIFRAVDWDFVEVFLDTDAEEVLGYESPKALCDHIASRVAKATP